MKLRRGFKREAEAYAEEFRAELNLEADGPLCPFQLAAHLEIPVVALSQLPGLPAEYLRYCRTVGQSVFSATTINDGTFKMIVHNDFHHPHRQNSNVTHELAHILLGHPPKPPLIENTCRNFEPMLEREASELGFTLLIPKRAALRIVESGMGTDAASNTYGVSRTLLFYRIRITDAKRWADNRRRKYRAAV
jgi:hypothetical protein